MKYLIKLFLIYILVQMSVFMLSCDNHKEPITTDVLHSTYGSISYIDSLSHMWIDTIDEFIGINIYDTRYDNYFDWSDETHVRNFYIFRYVFNDDILNINKFIEYNVINDTIYMNLNCFEGIEKMESGHVRIKTNIRYDHN